MEEGVLIRTDALSKVYQDVRALDALSLEIRRGEVFGLLGPNGSGKTTTIRLLLGLLRPTAGRATIAGFDCWKDSLEVRRLTSYLRGRAEALRLDDGSRRPGTAERPEGWRRPGPGRGDRGAGHEAGPPASGPDLFDGHEAEAGAGAGLLRPGGHPDPRRTDLGAGPVGPRARAGPGPGRAGARADGGVLRARAPRGGAGLRPRGDHAEGAADARRGHARASEASDAPGPLRAGRDPRAGPRAGTDRAGATRSRRCSSSTAASWLRCWTGWARSRSRTSRSAPRTSAACTTVSMAPNVPDEDELP